VDSRRVPALTVHRPWAALLLRHDGKDIENRLWSPRYRGPLLIHAGRAWDPGALEHASQLGELPGFDWRQAAHPTGIIGVVDLVDVCGRSRSGRVRCSCGRWAAAEQFHWLCGSPEPFDEPIPSGGLQKLWYPTGLAAARVERELRRLG